MATYPLGMLSTCEHTSVYSELDPPSEDEENPYRMPPEEEERED